MSHRRAGLALLLSACGNAAVPGLEAARSGATFTPDARGLAAEGTGKRIDFGRAPPGVIAALDRELGAGRDLGLAGCPAEIKLRRGWGDLVLTFTAERFVGWRTAHRAAGRTCAAVS